MPKIPVLLQRKRRAKVVTIPAPTGGLNTRDGLTAMAPNDAVLLDNWYPSQTSVDTRYGYVVQTAIDVSGYIETLMAYYGETTNKLLAASSIGTVFNTGGSDVNIITEDGKDILTEDGKMILSNNDTNILSLTGMSNGRFQYINFANSGGNYIIICNGADSVRAYNGTTWSTPAITGVTSADLIHVNLHKRRIWFTEEGTLSAWYLPVDSIAGAAAEFDLKSFASKGGFLMAMATATLDGGYGIDDLAIFITSRGQLLVYRGTDPASASTWALIGVWDVGSPVGRRCFTKWGGDLLLITQDGITPVSQIMQASRTKRSAFSDKIHPTLTSAVKSYGDNFGWQIIHYPNLDALFLNVPVQERASQEQYVMNVATPAWAHFTGWPAGCFEMFEDELYFGSFNVVAKAWSGTDDGGDDISAEAVGAFLELGAPGIQKRATMFGTILYANGNPMLSGGVNVDYDTRPNTSSLQTQSSNFGLWDSGVWDTAIWGPSLDIRRSWNGAAGVGNAFASTLNSQTSDITVQWVNSTITYEEGGLV